MRDGFLERREEGRGEGVIITVLDARNGIWFWGTSLRIHVHLRCGFRVHEGDVVSGNYLVSGRG